MRILLVDDESEFVSSLSERLDLRGFHSDWVSSGEEAMRRVKEECYDVAVLDMKMPKFSGIDLKKILQEDCPSMKFIFLTGHGSEDAFQAGSAETGVDNYLLKPVQIEDLVDRIRKIQSDS
jgi:DNA-binding response OmpR family regulator